MVRRAVLSLALVVSGASCSGAQDARTEAAPDSGSAARPAAAASSPPAPTSPEERVKAPPGPDPKLTLVRDEETAAMISVSYHSLYGVPEGKAAEHILELTRAATILRDASPLQRSRAIARLFSMKTPVTPALGKLRDRALQLLGPPGAKLDADLKSTGATTYLKAREVTDRALTVPPSACNASKATSTGAVVNGVVEVRTTLTVGRPLEELRKVVDPQNWDCCGNKYFSDACIPEEDDEGFVFIPGSVAPVCAVSTSSKPLPATGSAWKRPLYERFRVGVIGIDVVYFNTIIDATVKTGPGAADHRVEFSLNQSLGGAIAGSQGKCDIDDGTVTLTPQANGRVQVEATKKLRLIFATPEETALWSQITAATMPLAGDSLETSICCDAVSCPQP